MKYLVITFVLSFFFYSFSTIEKVEYFIWESQYGIDSPSGGFVLIKKGESIYFLEKTNQYINYYSGANQMDVNSKGIEKYIFYKSRSISLNLPVMRDWVSIENRPLEISFKRENDALVCFTKKNKPKNIPTVKLIDQDFDIVKKVCFEELPHVYYDSIQGWVDKFESK